MCGSTSRAQRPLTTGIVRRQFPSLRGTTWRNNGRSEWNVSRFEDICAFYMKITNIHGVNWKCHAIIVIKTDDGIVFIGPLGTNFSEIFIEIYTFSLNKMLSGKWRPFRVGLKVLTFLISGSTLSYAITHLMMMTLKYIKCLPTIKVIKVNSIHYNRQQVKLFPFIQRHLVYKFFFFTNAFEMWQVTWYI